jgi:hypothetical protein
MAEPLSTILLGTLASKLAEGGVDALFSHLESRSAARELPAPQARPEPVSIIDLTSDRPSSVRASVGLSAATARRGDYVTWYGNGNRVTRAHWWEVL